MVSFQCDFVHSKVILRRVVTSMSHATNILYAKIKESLCKLKKRYSKLATFSGSRAVLGGSSMVLRFCSFAVLLFLYFSIF